MGQIETGKLYNEDCRRTLARMPDNYLQCVITSPPYYGLRSYQTEPQIWDGDGFCNHVWGESLKFAKQDNRTPEQKAAQGASVGSSISFNDTNTAGDSGAFCQQCDAWRGELGLEPTFQLYISHLIQIFAEVKRVLKPDGTVFVNLGDSYAGSGRGSGGTGELSAKQNTFKGANFAAGTDFRPNKETVRNKSLLNIPHRFFIAMTDDLQFIQRNNINWWKKAAMPTSAKDRWTVDFESIGFFTKESKYKFNQDLEKSFNNGKVVQLGEKSFSKGQALGAGIIPSGNGNADTYTVPEYRNARTTWDIPYEPSSEEHYASYPTKLVEKMMRAGTDEGDIVYDPFGGTATTALIAHKLGRQWICSELQPKYTEIASKRLEPHLAQYGLF